MLGRWGFKNWGVLKRVLHTVVMTIFGLIFYSIAYYSLKYTAPVYLRVPNEITSEYFSWVTAIFTVIVLMSFVGANYVVYRKAGGKGDRRP